MLTRGEAFCCFPESLGSWPNEFSVACIAEGNCPRGHQHLAFGCLEIFPTFGLSSAAAATQTGRGTSKPTLSMLNKSELRKQNTSETFQYWQNASACEDAVRMGLPTPGPRVSFASRCSSCWCPRNARLEQSCSPTQQRVGEPRGCCHGAEHRFGMGVNQEQAGQDRTDLGVPLLRDVLPSPQCLRSSLPCSSPPLLMSHWEMSAGLAEHPAALSPPGCTSCRAPARGAARSRAS